MTFNEARAALAIGCKVCLPGWVTIIYVFEMDDRFIQFMRKDRGHRISTTPYSYVTSTDWEIYDEHKRSSAGTQGRL